MNRKERREFVKRAQKRGIPKKTAEAYAKVREAGQFKEGDKIKLNLSKIKTNVDYKRMSQKYRDFVEANEDTVFTAHIEKQTLVSLAENPEWLFWGGHLIKVGDKEHGESNKENDAKRESKEDI